MIASVDLQRNVDAFEATIGLDRTKVIVSLVRLETDGPYCFVWSFSYGADIIVSVFAFSCI